MGWTRPGYVVTAEYHVFADGRWMTVDWEVGTTPPVNVYVTEERMAPVDYRHQAAECTGTCKLPCGHSLGYHCDCDTIAAEASQGDPLNPVTLTIMSEHEYPFSAEDADAVIAQYETDPFYTNRFTVERRWESVVFTVAIRPRGVRTGGYAGPIMSFAMPLI